MKTTAVRPGRFAKLIRRLAAEPGSATPDELRRLRNVRRSKMNEALGPENGAALFFRAADACRKRDQRALAKNTRLSAKFFRDPTPAKTAARWDKLASRSWGRGEGWRMHDMTFLHKLVAEGRIEEVAHLLTDELLRMTDCYKDTPVHYAAKGGTLDQFPSGTHASVLPVSPGGISSRCASEGWTWTDRALLTSRNFSSRGNREKCPANPPMSWCGHWFSSSLIVFPLSGPSATTLGWSSRSLNIQASPIGPSPGSGAESRLAKCRPPQSRYW